MAEKAFTPTLREERIINAYTGGMKFGELRRIYNCSRVELADILNAAEIEPRRKPKKPVRDCDLPEDARYCFSGNCIRCGWNPIVRERRVRQLREERKYGAR